MTGASAVELPIGLWADGARHRQAVLRPLTGHDEELLLERAGMTLPAQRATLVLARCVERIGPVAPVGEETARRLVAGDREALLLHLRRLTFGDRMEAVIHCPQAGCGERLDVPLRVSELLPPAAPDVPEVVERAFCPYRVRFRLPCGADLEAAAEVAARNAEAGARLLLERSVEGAWRDCERLEQIPEEVAGAVAAEMAALDPMAEVTLELSCPACGHAFSVLLDAGSYLFDEVGLRARNLYREVHELAFHYHWSEGEILGMTPAKRRRYLDLLAQALSGGGE